MDDYLIPLLNIAFFYLKFRPRTIKETRNHLYKQVRTPPWSHEPVDNLFNHLIKGKVPWDYIDYHQSLIKGNVNVIEVEEDKKNQNLSLPQLLMKSLGSINKIKKLLDKNAVLMVWDSTKDEQKV